MRLPLSQAAHPIPSSRREARSRYLKRCDLRASCSRSPPTHSPPTFRPMPMRASFSARARVTPRRGGFRSSPRPPRTPSIGRRSWFLPGEAASRFDLFGRPCSATRAPFHPSQLPAPSRVVRAARQGYVRLLPPRPHAFQRGCRSGRNAPHSRGAPPGVTRARRRCLSPISATDHVVKRAPLGPTDPRATSSHSPVPRGLRAPRDPHVFVRAVKHDISHP